MADLATNQDSKRYAFIDVSNTKETTKTVFGFNVDWEKLIKFLKNDKWRCEKVFYYEGSRSNNKKFKNLHDRLKLLGYEVHTKETFLHKNKERNIKFVCTKCSENNSFASQTFNCQKCTQAHDINLNNKGMHPKANFDVEIAVDALTHSGPNTNVIFFSGDGDFRYLAERAIELGSTVIFVSTYKQTIKDQSKRFSTRLKDLITKEEDRARKLNQKSRVKFLEIDNFKQMIAKDAGAADED